MNTPRSNPEPDPDRRWDKLIQQARADAAPPTDVPALLRVVREATLEPLGGWRTELSALVASVRIVPTCLAATLAVVLLTTWELWDLSQSLPWAQLLASTGGAP